MAITASEAKKDSRGLDKAFLLLIIALENDVDNLSDDKAQEMFDIVMTYATANGIRDQDTVANKLIEAIVAYFIIYNALVLDAQRNIAVAKYSNDLRKIIPILNKAGATNEANDLRVAGKTLARDVANRFTTRKGNDGLTYLARIKTLQDGTEKNVRNIIANEVANGSGAREIAKKIQAYVKPTDIRVRPLDEARKRFNRKASFKPNVPIGSLNSNAMMIARTESAELYRDATSRFYGDREWVLGFKWVLSNSHPKHDVCDDLAQHGLYKVDDDRPFSHPHCVCDWQVVIDELNRIKALVSSGKLD